MPYILNIRNAFTCNIIMCTYMYNIHVHTKRAIPNIHVHVHSHTHPAHTHTLTHTLTHSLIPTLSPSHPHTFTLSSQPMQSEVVNELTARITSESLALHGGTGTGLGNNLSSSTAPPPAYDTLRQLPELWVHTCTYIWHETTVDWEIFTISYKNISR